MEQMYNNTFKRILAYIFDFLLVSVVVAMFSELNLINPYFDEYNDVADKYLEYVDSIDTSTEIDSSIVYNYVYQISYYSVYMNIIYMVFVIIYFIIFQYFNDGKTIGKALMRIKVVSKNGKKVKFHQLVIRTLIINGLLINILNVLSLYIFSKEVCLELLPLISFFDTCIMFTCSIMIIFRKDGRGLHDLISGTKIKDEKPLFVDKSVNNDL